MLIYPPVLNYSNVSGLFSHLSCVTLILNLHFLDFDEEAEQLLDLMGIFYTLPLCKSVRGQKRKGVISFLFGLISSTTLCLQSNPLPFQDCGLTFSSFLWQLERDITLGSPPWGNSEEAPSHFQGQFCFCLTYVQWKPKCDSGQYIKEDNVNIIKLVLWAAETRLHWLL